MLSVSYMQHQIKFLHLFYFYILTMPLSFSIFSLESFLFSLLHLLNHSFYQSPGQYAQEHHTISINDTHDKCIAPGKDFFFQPKKTDIFLISQRKCML